MLGYSIDKEDYLLRLRKIEGQVRGLQRVALGLVDQHLRHCVMQAAATSDDEAAAKLDEATRAIERLLRT